MDWDEEEQVIRIEESSSSDSEREKNLIELQLYKWTLEWMLFEGNVR